MSCVETTRFRTVFYALFGLSTQNFKLETCDAKKVSFRKNRKFSRFFAKKCEISILEEFRARLVVCVDTMQYNTTFYALFDSDHHKFQFETRGAKKVSFRKKRKFSRFFAKKNEISKLENFGV